MAEGARINVKDAWEVAHDPTPAQIQFPLARELAAALNVPFTMTSNDERLTITL